MTETQEFTAFLEQYHEHVYTKQNCQGTYKGLQIKTESVREKLICHNEVNFKIVLKWLSLRYSLAIKMGL